LAPDFEANPRRATLARDLCRKLCQDARKEDHIMPEITRSFDGQTVVTTFEMSPGTAADLMEALQAAYAEFICHQPGFMGAALHMNDAQTRIANYSKWKHREDFLAMLRTPEMRERNRVIGQLCSHFEPVMYEVMGVY